MKKELFTANGVLNVVENASLSDIDKKIIQAKTPEERHLEYTVRFSSAN